MTADFVSLLFPRGGEPTAPSAPACFRDLSLDQVVEAVAAHSTDHDVRPFFRAPLTDAGDVAYRQAIMRDMEQPEVRAAIVAFTAAMRDVRSNLALSSKLDFEHERRSWLLAAAARYVGAALSLEVALESLGVRSEGMRAFARHLGALRASQQLMQLAADVDRVSRALSATRYALVVGPGRATVRADVEDVDYSAVVARTFDKFRRGDGHDYRVTFRKRTGLNHVEGAVLDLVARLSPEPFEVLAAFARDHETFLDDALVRFDREVHFYLAWLAYLERFRRAGLSFCLPDVSGGELRARGAFDLALADRVSAIVTNDFFLAEGERVFVVSGPNQGGKTTFARMFGQIHLLASLGCHVPAAEARVPLADRVFSHFERQEAPRDERGGLKDDLVRAKAILDAATSRSVVVVNEIFASTTVADAVALSRAMLARLARAGARGVWVTFVPDLEASAPGIVSMVAGVSDADPSVRTFKLERRPPTGVAYAVALAEKYGLTYARLKGRLA